MSQADADSSMLPPTVWCAERDLDAVTSESTTEALSYQHRWYSYYQHDDDKHRPSAKADFVSEKHWTKENDQDWNEDSDGEAKDAGGLFTAGSTIAGQSDVDSGLCGVSSDK
ncbi:hypothetical protein IV498_13935 [Paenarthrobacter sp. Z7-10]|uniref:hypothetical protein n=1 Tax=Paenarthrobacter sp. Z7-10 TaxID=2787635 RepID=UPI0022A9742C|nr:hypothetical protein [Paenarthrobacter sp. Z7-10]MCZ2404249.1 hypothetical protein [Paenarthrobacter sp. Z7-10]